MWWVEAAGMSMDTWDRSLADDLYKRFRWHYQTEQTIFELQWGKMLRKEAQIFFISTLLFGISVAEIGKHTWFCIHFSVNMKYLTQLNYLQVKIKILFFWWWTERRWQETIPRILKREISPIEDTPVKNIDEDEYEVINWKLRKYLEQFVQSIKHLKNF